MGLQGHRPRTEPAEAWAARVTAEAREDPNTILQLTGLGSGIPGLQNASCTAVGYLNLGHATATST